MILFQPSQHDQRSKAATRCHRNDPKLEQDFPKQFFHYTPLSLGAV